MQRLDRLLMQAASSPPPLQRLDRPLVQVARSPAVLQRRMQAFWSGASTMRGPAPQQLGAHKAQNRMKAAIASKTRSLGPQYEVNGSTQARESVNLVAVTQRKQATKPQGKNAMQMHWKRATEQARHVAILQIPRRASHIQKAAAGMQKGLPRQAWQAQERELQEKQSMLIKAVPTSSSKRTTPGVFSKESPELTISPRERWMRRCRTWMWPSRGASCGTSGYAKISAGAAQGLQRRAKGPASREG